MQTGSPRPPARMASRSRSVIDRNQNDEPIGGPSPWLAGAELPTMPALEADANADVCVVGAGITGLSVAYHLARAGRSVIVLDAEQPGHGETSRTTAHLSNAIDDRIHRLEALHGEDGARLAVESHSAAIERIASIVREESIACDFERLDGYLMGSGEDA